MGGPGETERRVRAGEFQEESGENHRPEKQGLLGICWEDRERNDTGSRTPGPWERYAVSDRPRLLVARIDSLVIHAFASLLIYSFVLNERFWTATLCHTPN